MPRMTTVSISQETWQKLNVIRNEIGGSGVTMEDAVKECWAVRKEHQSCESELEKVKQELQKCREKW